MKYGELNLGQVEAIVNKLGGMDGVQQFLSGALIVTKAAVEKLLELVGTVMIPATKKFVARDHFATGSKVVKIGFIGNNFSNWFLGKTEKPNSQAELRYQRLSKNSLDKPILNELGNLAETTLSAIWELLKSQPNGENGVLLTNGCWNIFYVKDVEDVLRAVSVRWNAFFGSWDLSAYSVADPYGWYAGDRVFSCNSQSA